MSVPHLHTVLCDAHFAQDGSVVVVVVTTEHAEPHRVLENEVLPPQYKP